MTYIFQAKYIMTLQKVVTCNIYSAVFRIHAACFLTLPVITAKYIFFFITYILKLQKSQLKDRPYMSIGLCVF